MGYSIVKVRDGSKAIVTGIGSAATLPIRFKAPASRRPTVEVEDAVAVDDEGRGSEGPLMTLQFTLLEQIAHGFPVDVEHPRRFDDRYGLRQGSLPLAE